MVRLPSIANGTRSGIFARCQIVSGPSDCRQRYSHIEHNDKES